MEIIMIMLSATLFLVKVMDYVLMLELVKKYQQVLNLV